MSLDKGDLNTRLKALDNSIGKTETKIETIQVTGVDENGFTFTETKTIRTKVPVGDELQTSGLLAEEDKVVKNSTVLGRIEGEVIAGVEAIGAMDSALPSDGNSVGELTESFHIVPPVAPSSISLAYSPGIISLNFSNLNGDSDADEAFFARDSDQAEPSGTVSASLSGDSDNTEVSSLLNTLTGLGESKLSEANSGIAAVGGGAIQQVESLANEAVDGVNQVVTDVKNAANELLTSGRDSAEMDKLTQEMSQLTNAQVIDKAQELTSVADLKTGAGQPSNVSDILSAVENASGLENLTAQVKEQKNKLTTISSLDEFTQGFTDLTTRVNEFVTDKTSFLRSIDTQVDNGLGQFGGFLQDVAEEISKGANAVVNSLVGQGFQYDKAEMNSILEDVKSAQPERLARASKDVAVKAVSQDESVSTRSQELLAQAETGADTQEFKRNFEKAATEAGIDQEEIDTVTATVERVDNGLLELDTTIAGSVVLDADFFQRSDDVDNNAAKWSGRNTPDEAFTYVSSVEELGAEIGTIRRDIDTVVVHATETTTDKNIGAIEINNMQIDMNMEGIGGQGITYHYVIRRDGRLQRGRPVNQRGDHTLADSTKSIGIILVGGLNCSAGQESPTNFRSSQSFTMAQYKTLEQFLQAFYRRYPGGKVLGHNDVDDGELDPYFDVQDYVASIFRKNNG